MRPFQVQCTTIALISFITLMNCHALLLEDLEYYEETTETSEYNRRASTFVQSLLDGASPFMNLEDKALRKNLGSWVLSDPKIKAFYYAALSHKIPLLIADETDDSPNQFGFKYLALYAERSNDHNSKIRIYDIPSGEITINLPKCLTAWNSSQTELLTIRPHENQAKLLKPDDGTCSETLSPLWEHNHSTEWENASVCFNSEGNRVALRSHENTIRVWDRHTRECLYTLPHKDRVRNVLFSADDTLLQTVSDQSVFLWHAESGELVSTLDFPEHEYLINAHPNHDGTLLLIHDFRTVEIWDVPQGKCVMTLSPRETNWLPVEIRMKYPWIRDSGCVNTAVFDRYTKDIVFTETIHCMTTNQIKKKRTKRECIPEMYDHSPYSDPACQDTFLACI